MLLPEDMEITTSTKRNAAGQSAKLVSNKPPIEEEVGRGADEDSQSSKSDETQDSVPDSISVATDTSSGAESLGDVLQGRNQPLHHTSASCSVSLGLYERDSLIIAQPT